MIYILAGLDTKKRNTHLKKILGEREALSVPTATLSKELLFEHAKSVRLFGDSPAITFENALKDQKSLFSSDILAELSGSSTTFVFLEDKLLVSDEKKLSKHADIVHFDETKKAASGPKVNTFAIADAYGRHDKVQAWALYCDAIEKGIEPEAISGILFWKIKTLIQNGSKVFATPDLKKKSGELVSLYHRAHRGECDFTVGLEQFILVSLTPTAAN